MLQRLLYLLDTVETRLLKKYVLLRKIGFSDSARNTSDNHFNSLQQYLSE